MRISFPSSLNEIKEWAFFFCKLLQSIDFKNTIHSNKEFGSFVFQGCKSLEYLECDPNKISFETNFWFNIIQYIFSNNQYYSYNQNSNENQKIPTEITIPNSVERLHSGCLKDVQC